MKYLFSTIALIVFTNLCHAQKYFICFTCDEKTSLQISVCYENGKAVYVKYKGQDETIPLIFLREKIEKGSADLSTTYVEKYRGAVNGTYTITHSGNWDYVTYTRKKDNKKFNFTINHETSVNEKDNSYRTTPCF
jgi:hypothetical protein